MRIFDLPAATARPEGPLTVARWDQFGPTGLPFGAMWYTVPPGASSDPDRHPETELSVVVAGRGAVESGGTRAAVAAGDAFLLPGGDPHVVHNASSTEPLVVLSTFWLDGAR